MDHLDRRFLLGGLAGATGVAALANFARGGPLNPPAGAVAASGKTLTEVEPRAPITAATCPGDAASVYRITQPGSYYLVENLAGAAGKTSISVATAGPVTIDLMGFAIIGGGAGINFVAATEGATVRNGVLLNCDGNGVVGSFAGNSGPSVIEGLRVRGCIGTGIAAAQSSIVRGCLVSSCSALGISVRDGSAVEWCTAVGNTNGGIQNTGSDGTVRFCVTRANVLSGIRLGPGSYAADNVCSDDATGIEVTGSGCTVERNTVRGSTGTGISVTGTGSLIVGNRVGATGGSAFNIAASNRYGPIVDLRALGAAAVNGFAAAGTLTSTDPAANYVLA